MMPRVQFSASTLNGQPPNKKVVFVNTQTGQGGEYTGWAIDRRPRHAVAHLIDKDREVIDTVTVRNTNHGKDWVSEDLRIIRVEDTTDPRK